MKDTNDAGNRRIWEQIELNANQDIVKRTKKLECYSGFLLKSSNLRRHTSIVHLDLPAKTMDEYNIAQIYSYKYFFMYI